MPIHPVAPKSTLETFLAFTFLVVIAGLMTTHLLIKIELTNQEMISQVLATS